VDRAVRGFRRTVRAVASRRGDRLARCNEIEDSLAHQSRDSCSCGLRRRKRAAASRRRPLSFPERTMRNRQPEHTVIIPDYPQHLRRSGSGECFPGPDGEAATNRPIRSLRFGRRSLAALQATAPACGSITRVRPMGQVVTPARSSRPAQVCAPEAPIPCKLQQVSSLPGER